ncbi:MAG: WYL domain-containing protein [Subdoligranulum sp.]
MCRSAPRFYGWVAGFGTGIEILDPPSVRAEMKKKAG